MTNRLLIIFVLINLTSCSLYTKVQYVYEGKATYYLPNGETEVYNATYTEVFVNGIKESDNMSVNVGEGNAYFFYNIPHTFKGRLANSLNITNGGQNATNVDISSQPENGSYVFFYNGEKHYIPENVYYRLKYNSNGDNAKLNKALIEYVNLGRASW